MFFCFETMKMVMLLTKNENIRGGIGLVFIVGFFLFFFFFMRWKSGKDLLQI